MRENWNITDYTYVNSGFAQLHMVILDWPWFMLILTYLLYLIQFDKYLISSFRIFRVDSRSTSKFLICIWTYIHSYASLLERQCNKSAFVCKQGVLVLILPTYFDKYLIFHVFRVESYSKTFLICIWTYFCTPVYWKGGANKEFSFLDYPGILTDIWFLLFSGSNLGARHF